MAGAAAGAGLAAAKTIAGPRLGTFFQAKPKLANPYTSDGFLQRLLRRLLPTQVLSEVEPDFKRFGERIQNELEALGDECEAQPPYLVQMNAWGEKVDQVVTCPAWKYMKQVSAEEGLIAIGYENKFGEFSRLVQLTKIFLYHPSSGLYTCPLAMTDGAAKSIKELKLTQLEIPYLHLVSRSPEDFWTSGQWMTEKRGGSDVANGTETIAVPQINGKYKLYGYKFFSSATDSDMSLTLARIVQEDGQVLKGTQGLSMFFIKTRKEDGSLNKIEVMRLKDKLGTRQLPTGELLLDGTEADLASPVGRGVAAISNMLTITRIHNASASVSGMRRILSLSRDYSKRRSCFGQPISTYPLHVNTLAELEVETRAGTLLFFEVARLLGSVEATGSLENEQMLRLLTPIAKLYTGKKCIGVISEGLESFGGQGYMEDTGLPKILRDAQVTPIWEGTTNILSLDVLRAIGKSKGEVLKAWAENLTKRLQESKKAIPNLEPQVNKVVANMQELLTAAQNLQINEVIAREFAFAIAQVTIGTLFLEQAAADPACRTDTVAAERWINTQVVPFAEQLTRLQNTSFEDSSALVYDGLY